MALIEQPLPVGQEALLEGFNSPILIAADESAHGAAYLARNGARLSGWTALRNSRPRRAGVSQIGPMRHGEL